MLPTNYPFINYIYIYKQNLPLNNPEGLICHKTQSTNQPYFPTMMALALNNTDSWLVGLLVGLLVGFYGISTFVGYLMPNPCIQIISSILNHSV